MIKKKTKGRASASRPSRSRGVGSAEYLAVTVVMMAIALVPFGSPPQNLAQRVISAIKQEHAGFLFIASLPALPRGARRR